MSRVDILLLFLYCGLVTIHFEIQKKQEGFLGRAAILKTTHGSIETPAFVVVGTKATVKAMTPEQVKETGAQIVLANTYHLYLQPGEKRLKKAGGLNAFMHWDKPTMTDSGGFQVFSLGAGIGRKISKVASEIISVEERTDEEPAPRLAKIDEEGVTFQSHIDGSSHRFTPERSIEIQHDIGADMIFAFDECTAPDAPLEYQKSAMDRTHRWATRSLKRHISLKAIGGNKHASLFGIVQGGRFETLRKESARIIGEMGFDGYGIGGSFDKSDMGTAVKWVNEILPEEKPRHLLGIGNPEDLFEAVENGCDLFDCVAPTRLARNGALYTKAGRINILNAKFADEYVPIENDCGCYSCRNFTRAYLSHLYRANEILANTLGSIHNVFFIVNLVKEMRQGIMDGSFQKKKEEFLAGYKK